MNIRSTLAKADLFIFISVLAKEEGSDEDMAEMIASEIETVSNELKELEEKLKVSFSKFWLAFKFNCSRL